jgi:hypothetical protein
VNDLPRRELIHLFRVKLERTWLNRVHLCPGALKCDGAVSDCRNSASEYRDITSDHHSSAFEYRDITSDHRSSAFGYRNITSDRRSSAFGYRDIASDHRSSAFGYRDIASDRRSSAFEYRDIASDHRSSAFEYRYIASDRHLSVKVSRYPDQHRYEPRNNRRRERWKPGEEKAKAESQWEAIEVATIVGDFLCGGTCASTPTNLRVISPRGIRRGTGR